MATHTKPFIAAAAMASAAAIAVATPALAPSIANPTPPALSAAKVNLANFADLFSVPAQGWTDALYNGWGGAIGPINVDPQVPVNDYWIPNCNYDCTISGLSGVAYLALDALINGDGSGYDNAPDWGVSAVNYFFEGGLSTGLQYILERPFLGEPYTTPGPLYNPQIADAIALAFQGPYLLTTVYVTTLATASALISAVPVVGPVISGGINAYLYGVPLTFDPDTGLPTSYSINGLSGVLQYVTDLFTGGVPTPPAPPTASVAGGAAARTIAAQVNNLLGAAAPAAAARPSAAAVTASSVKPAASTADAVSENKVAADSTPDSTPAAEVDASVTTPSATKPADTAPAKAPRKRPIRDAVAGLTKSINSVVGGAAKAAAPASSDSGSSANAG